MRYQKNTLIDTLNSSTPYILRMVAVSPLGSDLTVMRLSVVPLDKDTLARLSRYKVMD
jgi:hypothetical protein